MAVHFVNRFIIVVVVVKKKTKDIHHQLGPTRLIFS